jgi:hypothetical protein
MNAYLADLVKYYLNKYGLDDLTEEESLDNLDYSDGHDLIGLTRLSEKH